MTSQPKQTSRMPARRGVVGGLVLLSAAGLSEALLPRINERPKVPPKAEIVLPNKVGDWKVEPTGEVVMPDQGADDGIYDQVVGNAYGNSKSAEIMLLTAYSARQEGAKRLHRPETCYEANGFVLTDSREMSLPLASGLSLPARILTARRSDRSELVVYWTRVANEFPQDVTRFGHVLEERRLRGLVPDGVLVRFSASALDPEFAKRSIQEFAMSLMRSVDNSTLRLMVGDLVANRIAAA